VPQPRDSFELVHFIAAVVVTDLEDFGDAPRLLKLRRVERMVIDPLRTLKPLQNLLACDPDGGSNRKVGVVGTTDPPHAAA